MNVPVIVLNFKAYDKSGGDYGLSLCQVAQKVSSETGASICACPPLLETAKAASSVSIPVFAQSATSKEAGAHTGWVTLDGVRQAGAKGVLVNHSEHRVSLEEIRAVVEKAKALGLDTVACAKDVEEAKKIAFFKPTAIAVEPPELIGSGISVSTARPEVVSDAVKQLKAIDSSIFVLVGAGVSNGADVAKCMELGAEGVLLASAFVKAKDPESLLREMAAGLAKK